MDRHRAALTRLAGFLDGLRTPIDGWQVAKQMQQIAREALGEPHIEFPPLRRECPADDRRFTSSWGTQL